ncbi:MAG TPA: sensor domain-containing diguanylate cyclase [Acidimicrobiia bacterium]|nr:sensor domain-containing diguanylate cyclase [Acidimicrobiia bacterium]
MSDNGRPSTTRWSWLLPHVPTPIALGVFALLRELDLLSDTPYWLLATLLIGASIINASTFAITRRVRSRAARIQVRLALSTITTATIIYATGWGSLVIVGFAVGVADVLRSDGSGAWRPGLIWTTLGVLAGQLAIAFDIAPILIDPRIAHSVAIAGILCIAVVLHILGVTAATAESAADELADREEQFRSMVLHASDMIGVIDAESRVLYVSPAVTTLLGYIPEECIGRTVDEFLDPAHPEGVDALAEALAARPGAAASDEVRLLHRDGSIRLTHVTATQRPDGVVVLNARDITAQRALEDRLTYQASHDALTGLLNRAALMEEVERVRALAALADREIAVLFVDLDGFKAVNDALGHEQGDRLLVKAARRIESCLREQDVVGRLGGDEFLVLLREVDSVHDAELIALRILDALAAPWLAGDAAVPITASIGIATLDHPSTSADELIRLADGAMYEAKRRGRRQAVLAGQA